MKKTNNLLTTLAIFAITLSKTFAEDPINVICHASEDGDVIFVPHPYECNKYFMCQGTTGIAMQCPGNLQFDANLNVCNYENVVGCVNTPYPTTSTTEMVTSTTEKVTTTADETTTIEEETTTTEEETTTTEAETTTIEDETTTTEDETTTTEAETTTTEAETTTIEDETTTIEDETTTTEAETTTIEDETTTIEDETTTIEDETTTTQSTTTTAAPRCPEGWLQFGYNCFYFAGDEGRKTWSESIEYCHTLDAYLAEVHDKETQTFLENYASEFSKTSWWLGASDQTKEGQWVWTRNDNQVDYTKWDIGEPNNGGIIGIFGKGEDCLYISSGWKKGYPWNDLNCSQKTSGGRPIKPICQKSIM